MKTRCIVFGQPKDLHVVNDTLVPVVLNNVVIPYLPQVKNLGVIFESSVSWLPYIKDISRKVMGGIYYLSRSRNFIPRELKPKLEQSLLFPYFSYCDSHQFIWT
jgi:hypothetical protein